MLALEDIRKGLGWNPWHFWGFMHPTLAPRTGSCDDIVYEYGFQDGDQAGRGDIISKIVFVHDQVANYLRYDVGLRWREDDIQWPSFISSPVMHPRRQIQADASWMSFRTQRVHVESLGYLQRDLIDDPAVTLTDTNGDGLYDEFSVSVVTTVTDASQIVAYFQEADLPVSEDDRFNLRYKLAPLKITIAAGTATIRGPAWILGKPSLYETQIKGQALDPTVVGNFAANIDVFREWMNPDGTTTTTSQAVLTWESVPYELDAFCCGVSGTSTDPASTGSILARGGVRDARAGIVYIAQSAYNSTTSTWQNVLSTACRPPNRGVIRYRAGVPLDTTWKQVLVPFVVSELPRRLCACDVANRAMYAWQFDLARTGGNDSEEYGATPPERLSNPFGTRRGQVEAWQFIMDKASFGSVLL